MSFQMSTPTVVEPVAVPRRRRRRVKKITEEPVLDLGSDTAQSQPTPTVVVNDRQKRHREQTVITRTMINFCDDTEDDTGIFYLLPDSGLRLKRVRILGKSGGLAGITVVNTATNEEICVSAIWQSEELMVHELSGIPETFTDVLQIRVNPGGECLTIHQIEVWSVM